MRDFEEDLELFRWVLWLRFTILMALLIGAMAVLDSFIGLVAHLSYLTGSINPESHPQLKTAFEEINQTPFVFMAINLYNLIVWNGVIVSAIWLFRYYSWARKLLTFLLGFDIVLTVIKLMWEAVNGSLIIHHPVWFIALNTIQVLIIIILSHPRMIEMIESLSKERRTQHTTKKLQQTLREKGDRE